MAKNIIKDFDNTAKLIGKVNQDSSFAKSDRFDGLLATAIKGIENTVANLADDIIDNRLEAFFNKYSKIPKS